MEIDPKTGLPIAAIEWEDITKSAQRIKVTNDKKRYGKIVTIVSGFEKGTDLKKIAKALKNELACGGTFKGDIIELQGNHTEKIKPLLGKMGFEEDSIEN
ncbi:MAG: stress response translation initiation inhibitor YciH [Candidatus Diapherotrites archaeon]|jgi:translation initiation factor 1|uniref:Stress response translation initiation inhibitor YciH n=1 Tax=Candidatus Iainarchaeum sp. TaxID=3101447 RepID=A0A8T5GFB5_9ARCH|nr:stress response translation initiation inhibitor YciH [Candidatus Diapherotrites archaeon]